MYTLNIESTTVVGNKLMVKGVFSKSGNDDFLFNFEARTQEEAKRTLRQIKGDLETIETEASKFSTGEMDISEPDVVEPIAPTQAQLDEAEWNQDWSKLQALKPYVDAGVIAPNATKLVALQNKVKTNFKPAYINLV